MRGKIAVYLLGQTSVLGRAMLSMLKSHPWLCLSSQSFSADLDPKNVPLVFSCDPNEDSQYIDRLIANGLLVFRPWTGVGERLLCPESTAENWVSMSQSHARSTALAPPDGPVSALARVLRVAEQEVALDAIDAIVLHPVEATTTASLDVLSGPFSLPAPLSWHQQLQLMGFPQATRHSFRLAYVASRQKMTMLVSLSLKQSLGTIEGLRTAWMNHANPLQKLSLPSLASVRLACLPTHCSIEPSTDDTVFISQLEQTSANQVCFVLTMDSIACGPIGGMLRGAEYLVRCGQVFW